MSQIEKLSIQGIRSFDNQHAERIEFTAPLTLIVGYNGSGKTTIIECLKYASTGQLPPNSKGGAFIHDPKLCGEKDVLAQVKLQFRNASNNKCIITRSLQLTVKKTTVSQKTLECQLMMINHGERISLSTRVAELDKIVPEQLGVSAAILENVIFCHQDDSLWPMSEPAKLKIKFDEIFEAQKYTKAIDNLTKMRKSQREELGKLVIHEGNFKTLKDKSERVQKKMLALEKEIDILKAKQKGLKKDIVAADAISKEKHEKKNAALGIVNELKTKTQQAEGLESFLASLRSNLEEMQDSDESLSSTLAEYEERMRQFEQQEADLQRQWSNLQENAKKSRRQGEEKQTQKGQYQAEKENYERSIQSRVQLVKEAARSHSLRGYDGDLEDHQIQEFVERIQKSSQEKDRELDRIRRSTNEELKQSQGILTELENKQTTKTQEKLNAKQAIAANEKKSKQRQQEADHIRMDEGAKAAFDTSLQDTKDLLQRALQDYETAKWDEKLINENTRLREQEQEERRLKQELFQSTKLSRDLAALEYTRKTLKEQQSALQTLISTYNDQLTGIVGQDWQPETLDRDFQGVLDRKARRLGEAKKQQDGADRDFSNLEFKLKTARSNLTQKTEEMNRCQSVVLNSIETEDGQPLSNVDDYPKELRLIEQERSNAQKDLDGMEYISAYYKTCEETVKDKNCCRLCRRTFASKQENLAAAEILKNLLNKYVDKTALKQELASLTEEYQSASAVRLQYDTFKKLHDVEIPAFEKDIKKLDSDRAVLLSKCEQLDGAVKDEEAQKRDIEALSTTVTSIANYRNDISKHEQDLDRLSSQQKKSGASMTISDIKEQSEACDERIRVLRGKIAQLSSDRDQAMNEINRLEREESAIASKVESASHQLEKKRGLLAEIDELRESTALHKKAIQNADAELTALGPQFAKAQTQHDDTQRRGQAKARDVQVEKDKLSETINKFKLVEDSINAYVDGGGPGKLVACQRAIKTIEQDLKRIESEVEHVTASHNEVKEHRAHSEHRKRSIVDNIRYRKTLRELETLKEDIQELESHNATDDYDHFHQEAVAADNHRAALTGELGPTVGSIRVMDNELLNLIAEYETEYKDAAEKYREMHVKVETTKAAIEDLGKCSGALDNAIMKYHSMKMEEINAIAGELWRSTYQGTDVDTIMIRSENESPTAKKRNYNYRVVMVKQDAEMDMRGRCSAGQKVLASIIIRLALAECFGINCGVIALDEPTTNLDQDNIRALAEGLNQIIKARKHQANFQLIIITHDEEFLKEMKCSEFSDIYFRVGRNADQNSTIKKEPLEELM